MHESVAAIWTCGRAALIPKPGVPNGWRPLGIGESWYRLMCRAIMLQYQKPIGTSLMPLQLAVGIPSGCEIGARLVQVAYSHMTYDFDVEDMCVISMDLENAYNLSPRRVMYDAVRARAPGLTRLFRTLYGQQSHLYLQSGEQVGICGTGVRQGCPCSTLFFSLGLQDTLEELQGLAEEVSRTKSHVARPHGVYAFADDITAYKGEKSAVDFCSRV